jgi:hypothetical protein
MAKLLQYVPKNKRASLYISKQLYKKSCNTNFWRKWTIYYSSKFCRILLMFETNFFRYFWGIMNLKNLVFFILNAKHRCFIFTCFKDMFDIF